MVRLSFAAVTEDSLALLTPDPILTHMDSGFLRYRLSFVIFVVQVDCTLLCYELVIALYA